MSEIARQFHDTYERLAPQFGYETREDTKVFDPQSQNGRLMMAVCAEVIGEIERERDEALAKLKCLPMDSEQGEPQPLRAGEPSDFEGAIRRMRDAERERDEARAHRDLAVVLYDELYTELCGANAERGAALRYIAALEDRVDSAALKAAQMSAQEEAAK